MDQATVEKAINGYLARHGYELKGKIVKSRAELTKQGG